VNEGHRIQKTGFGSNVLAAGTSDVGDPAPTLDIEAAGCMASGAKCRPNDPDAAE